MPIPPDYEERVYAGVLGKLIGVYLGRPFEGWTHERIERELGEITYYVHEKRGVPLIVTDDDITGTFTFLRALPDHGSDRGLTPAQVGHTWLNYIIEGRTILWWGGMGNSTEHTAYLRLESGIDAPRSGSIALNGRVVAEQIGAQIFADGWAMVAPGEPELAADLAARAASTGHDGEALHAVRVLAGMEAQAFVEPDLDALLDTGVSLIPRDCVIYRLIADLREWRAGEPDWRRAFVRLSQEYGYDRYGGNVHVVPNHGLIVLSLLYGDDDFARTLMIVNTCGWDTDCNSGNAGCLMGIKNGLAGIDAGPDWRGPVADRLYLPTADGGRAITDAVIETYHVVNSGRALAGLEPLAPKDGARFHFELPGSVQGFLPEEGDVLALENVAGHSRAGRRALALRCRLGPGRTARASTATFIPPEALDMPGYGVMASPTLYPGQALRAAVSADGGNGEPVTCCLTLNVYGADDELERVHGPDAALEPGAYHELTWRVPDTGGAPIARVGLEVAGDGAEGIVYLDYIAWDGAPEVTFTRPAHEGRMWRRAWVDGVDHLIPWAAEPYRLAQDRGRGLLIQGTREWTDYRVTADVTPHMVEAAGVAARVQGMRRYYGLLLHREGCARLVKVLHEEHVLAEASFAWEFCETHELSLEAVGARLRAWIDGQLLFDVEDGGPPLAGGGVALVCEEGRTSTTAVAVRPA